jgi:cytochrome c oxidase subunit II
MRPQDMLAPAGPQAERILELWWVTLAICAVVFIAVLVALGIALLKKPSAARGAHAAVAGAVALSTVLLVALIFLSFGTDRALATLPGEDPLRIELIAHRWWWEARYQDPEPSRTFTTANELHIPVGRAVEFTLKADDVIHSLWVPNLGGKKDLIPGRTGTLRLRADKAGVYRGQCAEYCGTQHAKMALLVFADNDYESWAKQQRTNAPEPKDDEQKRGLEVFLNGTCAMCHAIQGTPANGRRAPDLTHFAGRETLGAGAVPNTRGHLAGWIIDPHGIKPGVNMPAHTTLAASELHALIAYLESLK